MAEKSVDLLVVGAGPAGSSAALASARSGLSTLVVERGQVGRPVRCGEYVPAALRREVPDGVLAGADEEGGAVAARVPCLALHLPRGQREDLRAPGLVISRDLFDRALADAAVAVGAELRTDTPLLELGRGGRAVIGGGETVRARVVIGADGPRSLVARSIGLGGPQIMLGLGRRVRLGRRLGAAHLFFRGDCPFGYGWLFPKGEGGNLGVALPRGEGRAAAAALEALQRDLVAEGLVAAGDAAEPVVAGLVPSGGPLARLGAGRVLLAGDAAGQTDALSGAGIVAAVRGGTLAGQAAAEALAAGRPSRAADIYEGQWRRQHGRHAARQVSARHELEALWGRDPERAVRRAWSI